MRPIERRRSRSGLTLIEREEISRDVVAGTSIRAIAATLGRAPSTISREIRRNDSPRGYRASQADQAVRGASLALAVHSFSWLRQGDGSFA
jgi:transposase, IS30 family